MRTGRKCLKPIPPGKVALRSRAGWQNVSAVRNGKICELDPDLLSRPGPKIIDGLAELKGCLYD